MKNTLSLFALVACFTVLTASTATAQGIVKNYTNCEVIVKVAYGDPVTCVVAGYASVTVGPVSGGDLNLPNGTQILKAKGKYTGSSCIFNIGQSCSGLPLSEYVSCSTNCGDYGAKLYPASGIAIQN